MQTSRILKRHVRLLLFDLDGTLVDSIPDLAQSVNFVRRRFGLKPLSTQSVRGFTGDGAWMLVERSLQEAPPDLLPEGVRLYREHYTEHCTDFTRVYPGCREMLQHFQDKRIAVVTNKPDSMSRRILDAYGLSRYVGCLIGGDTARKKKPAPEHLIQALEWAGCAAEGAMIVGDSGNDVEAAAAAGIACCGVTFGIGRPVGRRGERPAFTINNLSELRDRVA